MRGGAASWAFQEQDFHRIHQILEQLLRQADARCVLLVDRTGQLVTSVGERPAFDSTAFASLAAADFSANDQLASMIGEQEFSSLFHQGEKESMYLADIVKRLILVVLFDNRSTIGMVRLRVRSAVPQLGELFEAMFERSASGPGALGLEDGFADEAEDEIDRLFGNL
ncbi:MAG TPA: roadblock/LC7 domain-containing protein [Longimicrobiaceae bacterium]|jgi:predicted regulator of Ras-like GTPase activity (Roadblock/LC7/MglB family)|nr:roadblock/LC7 domain-containing protein [Longimicrobiaceae bacterium]